MRAALNGARDCNGRRNVDAAVDLIAASKTTSRPKRRRCARAPFRPGRLFDETGGWSFASGRSRRRREANDQSRGGRRPSARMLTRTHSTTPLNLGLSFVARVRAVASSDVKPVRGESAVRCPSSRESSRKKRKENGGRTSHMCCSRPFLRPVACAPGSLPPALHRRWRRIRPRSCAGRRDRFEARPPRPFDACETGMTDLVCEPSRQ